MPTLNALRVGYIRGTPGTNYSSAKTNNGSTAFDSPTGNVSNAIMAFFSSGRGGGTYLFHRTYVAFDTSGITSTVQSANFKFSGYSTTSAIGILLSGGNGVFGGDGGTALATTDFNAVDILNSPTQFSTQFSFSTGQNSISFTSSGLTQLVNQSYYPICIVNATHDLANNAPSSTVQSGIAFGTTIQLEYELASTSNILNLNGEPLSNITSFSSIILSNIGQINGISN